MKTDEMIVHCLLEINNAINRLGNGIGDIKQNKHRLETIICELMKLNQKMDYIIERSQNVDSNKES